MIQGVYAEYSRSIYISFGLAVFVIGLVFSCAMLLYGLRKKDHFSGIWGFSFVAFYIIALLIFQPIIFKAFDIYRKEQGMIFFKSEMPHESSFFSMLILQQLTDMARAYYSHSGELADTDQLLELTFGRNAKSVNENFHFEVNYSKDSIVATSFLMSNHSDTFRLCSPLPIAKQEISQDSLSESSP